MAEMTSTVAEEQTPQEQKERFQRKRGAGFPIVPLPECVEVLRTAGKHGNEHSSAAFATYLGHSTPNSGSFKSRLASFRDWKFIANATGNRVVFTELGRRVAHPTDPAKERSDLQEAFENCTIFMRAWDESAKGVPMALSRLANLGVQLGVSPMSKQQFAESLIESAAAAEFAELDGDEVIFVRPTDDAENDRRRREFSATIDAALAERERREEVAGIGPVQRATRDALADRPESSVVMGSVQRATPVGEPYERGWRRDEQISLRGEERQRNTAPGRKPAALHQQSLQIPGGNLTFEIRSDRSLPAEAFIQIGKVMAEVEKLKKLLTKDVESGESTE
jgi:hypothetical protein